MTKQLLMKWNGEEYRRNELSNLLSKVKDIIAKDEVIPGFIGVMQKKRMSESVDSTR